MLSVFLKDTASKPSAITPHCLYRAENENEKLWIPFLQCLVSLDKEIVPIPNTKRALKSLHHWTVHTNCKCTNSVGNYFQFGKIYKMIKHQKLRKVRRKRLVTSDDSQKKTRAITLQGILCWNVWLNTY